MAQTEPLKTLQNRLSQAYHLEQQDWEFEGHKLKISAVTNVEELMEALIAKGDDHPDVVDDRLPYWAELWPSAIGLAMHVLGATYIGPQSSVLEIGCGLGLPGLAANLRGAAVTLTDYLPEPLELARLNWLQNFQSEPDCRLLDWRKAQPEFAADIVLASDVSYEKRAFEPLIEAFRTLMKPNGVILLSEPNRTMAQPFLTELPKMGFKVQEYLYPVTLKRLDYTISVREIRRSKDL